VGGFFTSSRDGATSFSAKSQPVLGSAADRAVPDAGALNESRAPRRVSKKLVVLFALCVVVQLAIVARALADVTAGDGGNTVTVGASNSSSAPGGPGHPTSGGAVGGGVRGPVCSYTLLPPSEQATLGTGPASGPGNWYELDCTGPTLGLYPGGVVWLASPTAAATAPANPSTLLAQAVRSLALPSPNLGVNPPGFSVTNLPTWLWIDPAMWHAYSATASAGGVSATAVATPVAVAWQMGDGGSLACNGPGVPYQVGLPATEQHTYCSYTYRQPSIGEPSPNGDVNDGAFPVRATVSWAVTWTASGAPGGGTLPPLSTTSTTAIKVEQVESIGTAS